MNEPEQDDPSDTDPWENAPYVCPGCYAVGEEECAPDCVDAAIEADRQWRYDRDENDYDWFDRAPSDDDEDEPVPESQRTPPLQEAAAELALCQKRLERSVSRLVDALTPTERQVLDRRFAHQLDPRGPRPASSPAELLFGRPPSPKVDRRGSHLYRVK